MPKSNVTWANNRSLIEVALPLEAISAASAREKSIRHGQVGWFPEAKTQAPRGLLDEVSRMLTTLRRRFRAKE